MAPKPKSLKHYDLGHFLEFFSFFLFQLNFSTHSRRVRSSSQVARRKISRHSKIPATAHLRRVTEHPLLVTVLQHSALPTMPSPVIMEVAKE